MIRNLYPSSSGEKMPKGRVTIFIIGGVLGCLLFIAGPQACPNKGVVGNEEAAMAGYTLLGIPNPVLLDMTGQTVQTWPLQTGFPTKMLPGGDVLGSKIDPERDGVWPVIQQNWDREEVWSYSDWNPAGSAERQDLQREGNPVGYYAPGQPFKKEGNTMVAAFRIRPFPEVTNQPVKDDTIYEVNWNSQLTGYEWSSTAHFEEYGFDAAAKEAIYKYPLGGDWLHVNAMSYVGENQWYRETGDERFNPQNLMISAWRTCMIFIVSRETGHVVWKIGPDYAKGPEKELGQIQGQHFAHIIPQGLPGAGNVLVFDNGAQCGYGGEVVPWPKYRSRSHSRVIEFNPVTFEKVWEYGIDEEDFYSEIEGSAQRLPNGNTLVTVAEENRVFEVTRDKKVVWEYKGYANSGRDLLYRAYRVPPEWLPEGMNLGDYPSWESLSR
jgi:hypothetical protein